MARLQRSERIFLVFIVIYSLVPTLGGLVRVFELTVGMSLGPLNPRALAMPLPVVAHILGSVVFCIGGALQFLPSLRPRLHRRVGPTIVMAGIVSAGTGLWMTVAFPFPPELQGPALYWVRIALGTAMIALLVHGITAARARRFTRHRAAMLAAYAIGQGASTQVLFGLPWAIATGADPIGPTRDALMILAWAANLFVAMALIRRPVGSAQGTAGRAHLANGQTASDQRP